MAVITTKLQTNRVRIQQKKTGQFTITVPKVLAMAYELKGGDDCEWVITNQGLLLKRIQS